MISGRYFEAISFFRREISLVYMVATNMFEAAVKGHSFYLIYERSDKFNNERTRARS